MKNLLTAFAIAAVMFTGQPVDAEGDQQAPPPPPPAPARQGSQVPSPPGPPPLPPPALVNVRINIAVIDEGGPQSARENVTLTTVEGQEASLRSDVEAQKGGPVILNVDATPLVSGLPSGKIRVRVSLDYLPRSTDPKQPGARTRLQLAVIVDDGKTIVASDTSDPATDRRVRVEVTATTVK